MVTHNWVCIVLSLGDLCPCSRFMVLLVQVLDSWFLGCSEYGSALQVRVVNIGNEDWWWSSWSGRWCSGLYVPGSAGAVFGWVSQACRRWWLGRRS
ncbi:unnamed protein product [Camellia sinensis]